MQTQAILFLCGLMATYAADAADFGTIKIGDEPEAKLSNGCAYQPRVDTQGWGKPEVTVLLSSVPLDCAAISGWFNPDNGAFDQAVRKADGTLLSVSFQPGLKLGRVTLQAVGYALGNDDCAGCAATASYAGTSLKGSLKTTTPLKISDSPIVIDARFELPKPTPVTGTPLPGGGDAGKAYLAYLKAYADGDYEALKNLRAEGEAESEWGYYQDEAERKAAITGSDKPKTAKVLSATRYGDSVVLIVEHKGAWSEDMVKAAIGLGFDGKHWRIREERVDFAGNLLSE